MEKSNAQFSFWGANRIFFLAQILKYGVVPLLKYMFLKRFSVLPINNFTPMILFARTQKYNTIRRNIQLSFKKNIIYVHTYYIHRNLLNWPSYISVKHIQFLQEAQNNIIMMMSSIIYKTLNFTHYSEIKIWATKIHL